MSKKRHPQRGFTIVGLMIGLTILVVAISGLLSTVASASQADRATKERSAATNAARTVLEETKVQFDTVDEYVAFYTGPNTSIDLALLQVPLDVRRTAALAYMAAGMPAGLSLSDFLPPGSMPVTSVDKSLVKLNNAQGAVNVIKLNNNLMTVTVTISWTGAMGNTAVSVQTDVGK